MISKFGKEVLNRELVNLLMEPQLGLEVERQRIDGNGAISHFPYPRNVGNQQTNQWITNDFMQTMSEVVTPVADSDRHALRYLTQISNILRAGLADGEYLWPLSMPPALPKDRTKVDVSHATAEKRRYFFTWLTRHPLEEATPCGLHINIGLNQRLVAKLALNQEAQNDLYLKVAQGFLRYRYVLTYLFGASPIAEKNYFLHGEGPAHRVRSIRQSHFGFGTKFSGDFTCLPNYVRRIESGVADGTLLAEHDFHSPVRLRGKGDVAELLTTGVTHLELRMFDLNPWSSVGISSDELAFTILLAAFLAIEQPVSFNLAKCDDQNEEVAMEEPTGPTSHADEIRELMKRLHLFAAKFQLGEDTYDLLDRLAKMIDDPSQTLNGRLVKEIKDNSLVDFGVAQAKTFQTRSRQAQHVYVGFGDQGTLTADELRAILG